MAKDKAPVKKKVPSAVKRNIQAEKKRLINRSFRSRVRTAVRSFEDSLKEKNEEKIQEQLSNVYSLMDKGVKRGVFQRNKASRTKARFAARIAKLSA